MTDTTPAVRIGLRSDLHILLTDALKNHRNGVKATARDKEAASILEKDIAALAAAPVAPGGEGDKSVGQRAFEGMRDNSDCALGSPRDCRLWEHLSDAERKEWEDDATARPHLYSALRARSSPNLSGGGASKIVRDYAEQYSGADSWFRRRLMDVAALIDAAALSPSREGVEPEAGVVAWQRRQNPSVDWVHCHADDVAFYRSRKQEVRPLYAHPSPAEPEAGAAEVTIFCPTCSTPHIDEGEWATRRHKTHQCQSCGHEWRPFPFATVGVAHPTPADDRLAVAVHERLFQMVVDCEANPETPLMLSASVAAEHASDLRQALALLTKSGEAEG